MFTRYTIFGRTNKIVETTHFDRLPPIGYRRSLSIGAHDFPHFLDGWIGRHQVVKGQLILLVNPADVATPGDLPEDQAERVHVGPLERVEVIHVYHLFKNLKAESICVCQRAKEPPSSPSTRQIVLDTFTFDHCYPLHICQFIPINLFLNCFLY